MRRGEKDGEQGKGGEGSAVEDKNYKQNSKCEIELSDAEQVQRESDVLESHRSLEEAQSRGSDSCQRGPEGVD